MKYFMVGIKGAGMSALANILYKDGHTVEGVDVKEDFYTSSNLSNISIVTFEEFVIKEDFIYIIGNAYVEHFITKDIIKNNLQYEFYPKFIAKYFKDFKMIAVAGSHGTSNLKGKQKYGLKSTYFRLTFFYFSLKIG